MALALEHGAVAGVIEEQDVVRAAGHVAKVIDDHLGADFGLARSPAC